MNLVPNYYKNRIPQRRMRRLGGGRSLSGIGASQGMVGVAVAALGEIGARVMDGAQKDADLAKAAYLVKTEQNVKETLTRIGMDHGDDLASFDARTKSARAGWLGKIDDKYREPAAQLFDAQANGMRLKVMVGEKAKQEGEANATLVTGMDTYANEAAAGWRSGATLDDGSGQQVPVASLAEMKYRATLESRTDLTPQQKAAALVFFEQENRRQSVLGHFERAQGKAMNTGGAEAALKAGNTFIKAFAGRQDLDPNERDKLISEMQGGLKDTAATLQLEKSAQDNAFKDKQAAGLALLDLAISRKEVGFAQLEKAANEGLFAGKPARYTALAKAIDKNNADQQGYINDRLLVNDALAGGGGFDGGDASHRKAFNSVFEKDLAPKLAELSPEQVPSALAEIVRQTRLVPDKVVSELRVLAYGAPEQVAQAADMLDRFYEVPGVRLGGIDQPTQGRLGLVQDMVAAGLDPKAAVDRANALTDPTNQPLRDVRKTFLKQMEKDVKFPTGADISDEVFDGWFSIQPDTPEHVAAPLAADYKAAYERHYLLTGDQGQAHKWALTRVQSTWGVTEADGGKRLMKYPPEVYYGHGADQGWIGAQLKSDVAAHVGTEPTQVMLLADGRTAREAGAKHPRPSWTVLTQDENGVFNAVPGFRWYPDRKTEAQKGIDGARADRAALKVADDFEASQLSDAFMDADLLALQGGK